LTKGNFKVLIYATNREWGGSEHLWYDAVSFLLDKGADVHVLCEKSLLISSKQADLLGRCHLTYISRLPKRLKFILRASRKFLGIDFELDFRIRHIKSIKPDFVFINQGLNFDAFDLLFWLSENNINYGIISHAVDHRKSLNSIIINALKSGFAKSTFNGFVSNANIHQTSAMIDMEIPNTRVFRNPVSRPDNSNIIPYPSSTIEFSLAFVGRIDFKVKGQDMLLQVLQYPKWQKRNLNVRFYGDGPDREKLELLLLDFSNGKHVYAGYKNPSEIWAECHALVLTSHFEGLPIVIIEAGLYGRTCVVTNVSGNAELISNHVDGFVAQTDTIEAIDEALEIAWEHRLEWQQMGLLFKQKLQDILPNQPGKVLADTILEQVQR